MRLLSQFVEEMDLTDLYSTYERINSLSPRTLLKIVLYSYMNGNYSSRSMELNCKRDINFMFLLEGHSAPDHATLARFRSIHFAPCSKRILAEVSNLLFDIGEISGETIFIDGTKIEASHICTEPAVALFLNLQGSAAPFEPTARVSLSAHRSTQIGCLELQNIHRKFFHPIHPIS